eukprot:10905974-Alexandrium_andersonii.AAC.1
MTRDDGAASRLASGALGRRANLFSVYWCFTPRVARDPRGRDGDVGTAAPPERRRDFLVNIAEVNASACSYCVTYVQWRAIARP